MTTQDLFTCTKDQLHQLKVQMTEPEWSAKVESAPATQRTQAQLALLHVQQCCLAAENAELENLVAGLQANEQALIDAQKAAHCAFDRLSTVQSTLKAVTAFVNVVAKIIPLV